MGAYAGPTGSWIDLSFSNSLNGLVKDGLVLALDAGRTLSYPGSGTTWTDLSGNGNNGTLTNGPTYSSANGGSIVFDGSNDYVRIPYSSIFNIQNYTLSVWVQISSFSFYNSLITNPQNGTIVGSWNPPYLSWMLRVKFQNLIEVGTGSNSSYLNRDFSYNFSTGIIYNIVATYDGSFVFCYVNGVSLGSQALSTTINYTSQDVIIGADYGGAFSSSNIYNTSVYNKALTASEVQQNFNALRGRYGI